MRFLTLFSLSLGLSLSASAAESVEVKLWPGKAPGETRDIGPEKSIPPRKGQIDIKRLTAFGHGHDEPVAAEQRAVEVDRLVVVGVPGQHPDPAGAAHVLHDHPELHEVGHITLLQSFRCVRLVLWDEVQRRLVSFCEIRA